MMSLPRLAVSAALLAWLGAPVLSSTDPEPTAAPALAVIGIGGERQSPELQALQEGLVHLVQSDLVSRSAARVVSRGRTTLLLDELGMTASQLTEPATSQRFGQAVSADYLAFVRLSEGGQWSAEVTVEEVARGAQVWSERVTTPAPDLPALAAKVADSLSGALHLARPRAALGPALAPVLAVLDFRSEGTASALDRHTQDLADLLCANLTALDVPLVERRNLGAVLGEMGLSASGLVKAADMARVGRLLGAERMLDTSMIVAGEAVVLDGQLIEPATGLVVASCRVAGEMPRLPALVQQLATETAQALRVPVTEEGRRGLAQQATASLEAALHAAAGWRLGQAGQAEEAAKEYQQAIYLAPSTSAWWYQLGQQYRAAGDERQWAETIRRFFAAAGAGDDADIRASMACELAQAETSQHHPAEAEAAARLALQYRKTSQGYEFLVAALVRQRRFAEARAVCESLAGRSDVPHDTLEAVWSTLLASHVNVPGEDSARECLTAVSRALDIFGDGDPLADRYVGVQVANALLMSCGLGRPDWLVLDQPVAHVEEGLALARRMTTRRHLVTIPSRGWFLLGLLEYKLGRAQEALEALNRCLSEYPTAIIDVDANGGTGPANGLVHYAMGRVFHDLFGDPERAIAAYQQALYRLSPGRAECADARRRLAELQGHELPPAPWLRSIGGAGQWVEGDQREQLQSWLRGRQYDLRPEAEAADRQLSDGGIQLLIWRGRTSDYPPAEQLRSYVAGGGNLFICLGSPRYSDYFEAHGPVLAVSPQSLDATMNWLLPAFGMRMSNRAVEVESLPLDQATASLRLPLDAPRYSGALFPLLAPATMPLLGIRRAGEPTPDIAAAVGRLGLGKVAVVSLREWFVAGDLFRVPPQWQYQLFQGLLDWFAADEVPPRHPGAAQHWAAARRLVAAGDHGAAVQELDKVEDGVPSAADARYWAGCLLADRLSDIDGAAQRWRRAAAAQDADPWLVRMAHLRLGVAAVRAGDERTAMQELALAAEERPDGIWGQAWIAVGDLKLVQGDFLGAAQVFRKVADELSHSEERFRALFGLGDALERQGKPEAGARVYEAIVVEFGKAPLPLDMDTRWPDLWPVYFPQEKRPDEPTVADAVTAVRAGR